jgi:hypothetical protein
MPQQKPEITIDEEAAWILALVWMLWRREDLFPLPGIIKPQFLDCPAHSLVTILAELSLLVMSVK